MYQGQIGVKLSFIAHGKTRYKNQHPNSLELLSYSAYEKRAQRNDGFRLRHGKGHANESLISWNGITEEWKSKLISTYGSPGSVRNPLELYYTIDAKAKAFYEGAHKDSFRFDDGSYLTPEQAQRYTINASVLNALLFLKNDRETSRKMRNSNMRGLWKSLINDTIAFNDTLKKTGAPHTLPPTKIKQKLLAYVDGSYLSLIDGRAKNTNAQVVSPQMLAVWRDIYAGQRSYKPDYSEVSNRYDAFLAGLIDVVHNSETGECYDRTNPAYKPACRRTVHHHQSAWQHRAPAQSKRSGDRQKFMTQYDPYHKLIQPEFAGSLISVDDRQPPFKNLAGDRIWFYLAIDLGSEAITTWVYGDSKEGLILEFYRQMVRNYSEWGLQLPNEIECESSLNSSYADTFLSPGAMFPKVRIEANKARSKRIERHFRDLRYSIEKKREGWIARPHSKSETNQQADVKIPRIPQEKIIDNGLADICTWNSTLHSNQVLRPNKDRWDVFLDHQHPQERPYNWPSILSGLGKVTRTTMRAGRIALQGKHRVVGQHGIVATGDELINIMTQIEGERVEVKWLDGNDGEVLKALVYDKTGRMVCELLGDLAYHRAHIERTPQCEINRALTSAYANTVQSYIKNGKNEVNTITIIEQKKETARTTRFSMPGQKTYQPRETITKPLPAILTDFERDSKQNKNRLSDRF